MLNEVFPAFNIIHMWLEVRLPLIGCIAIWGVIAGLAAMTIYTTVANQAVISKLKTEIRNIRGQMLDPSLESYSEYTILAKNNLTVSLTLLGTTIGPALLSAVPVLLLAVWLDTYHGYILPEKQNPVSLTVIPDDKNIRIYPSELAYANADSIILVQPSIPSGKISLHADGQLAYSGNPFSPPVPVITKEKWWNFLLAGKAGYVISVAPIEEIHMNFPRKRIVEGWPGWAAGWELTFFFSVIMTALALKIIFRID